MPERPRRRFLQLCSAAATVPLVGCGSVGDPTDTATPTATATATTTATAPTDPTASASPTPEPTAVLAWAVDRLAGGVDTLLLPDVGPTDDPAGPLYAATRATEVARIDPVDGRPDWTTTLAGSEPAYRPLASAGDAVYAVSETLTRERLATHVQALDPATGDARWTFEDRAFLRLVGVVDDLVVLAGEYIMAHPEEVGMEESNRGDGRLYGLDRATGDERWSVAVPTLHGADVADHGVYALAWRDDETYRLTLRAFDLEGTDRWRVDTATPNPDAPLAAEDLLLAGASDDAGTPGGAVGRYDPADGSLLWAAGNWERGPEGLALRDDTIHVGARPFLALGREGLERYRVQSFGVPDVPATPETLYRDAGTSVPAVDRDSGELRWRYRPEDHEYTSVRAVLADHVAVDRGIGRYREVALVSESSGEPVGTFQTPGHYLGMTGAGRRLFVGVGSDVLAYDVTVGRP